MNHEGNYGLKEWMTTRPLNGEEHKIRPKIEENEINLPEPLNFDFSQVDNFKVVETPDKDVFLLDDKGRTVILFTDYGDEGFKSLFTSFPLDQSFRALVARLPKEIEEQVLAAFGLQKNNPEQSKSPIKKLKLFFANLLKANK